MSTNDPAFEISTAPYPGLRPFGGTESDIFFGREKQTDQLLQRLSAHRFLAVTGPSGCGKSSLVRAGMIPALNVGFLAVAGSRWRVCKMRPGDRPMARLAERLAQPRVLGADRSGPEALPFVEAALRRGPLGLAEMVGECEALRGTNMLVMVDQFEELFRYREQSGGNEADAFVELLLTSALRTDLPIYVVITMRSDYLGDCALFHGLPEAINNGQYLTPHLTREECRSAIVGPAKVFGGSIDEALVNRLLNDFGPDPDQLPLLQHALMRMWNRATGRAGAAGQGGPRMTVADYEAVGGLSRALSSHADEAMAELDPEQQRIAQVMFRRLTERLSGKRDTRAPARLADVAAVAGVDAPAVTAVMDVFRRSGRCFIANSGGDMLDISHESLSRQWETLARWVEQEAESAAMYRRLRETARLWKQGRAGLWREPDLGHAVGWQVREKPTAAWASRYGDADSFSVAMDFLHSSEQAERRALERRLWKKRALVLVFALLAIGVVPFELIKSAWYVKTTVSYYNEVVKVRGVPRGVGRPLTLDEVRHRSTSFELTTRGSRGPVIQMRAVDGRLEPATDHEAWTYFAYNRDQRIDEVPVKWTFGLDTDGWATHETAYNMRGKALWIFLYLPGSDPGSERDGIYLEPGGLPRPGHRYVMHLEYTKEGYQSRVLYRNRLGAPVTGRDGAFGIEYVYNEVGSVVAQWSLGPDGKRMNDEFGNSGQRMVVNDRGNILESVNYDADDQETTVKEGWNRARYAYDRFGRATSVAYFDSDWKPVVASTGYHRATVSYDEHGLLKRLAYWDRAGGPAPSMEDGCYGHTYEYDLHGRRTHITCEGADGRPGPDNDGVISSVIQYDEHDRISDWSLQDGDGRLVPGKDGYCRVKYEYDGDRLIRERYFDAAGSLAPAADGYARVDMAHDGRGNTTRFDYFGVDEKPFVLAEGYSSLVQEFEEGGAVSRVRYLGPDGERVLSRDGYAEWRSKYDAQGNETKKTLVGLDGQPTIGREGYAVRRYEYDPLGNCIQGTNFDARNQPVLDADRIAIWRSKYDKFGRRTGILYFDTNGVSTTHRLGYASVLMAYDEKGNIASQEFRDTSGNLVAVLPDATDGEALHGYARVVYAYTPQGKVREETYLDVHGHLTLVGEGYARVVRTHDARGNVVETEYYDASGQRMVFQIGFQSVPRGDDVRGDPIE